MKRISNIICFFLCFLFLSLCCFNRKLHNLDEITIAVEEEKQGKYVYFIDKGDTLAKCAYPFDKDKIKRQLFNDSLLLDSEKPSPGWSCSPELSAKFDKNFENIANLQDLSTAINIVLSIIDEDSLKESEILNFLIKNIFKFHDVISVGSNTNDNWESCEEFYVTVLYEALSHVGTSVGSNSLLYLRSLDSCQIVESINSSKMASQLRPRQYLITLLHCPNSKKFDIANVFPVNKFYFLVTFYDSGNKLNVKIELLNKLSLISWIGM